MHARASKVSQASGNLQDWIKTASGITGRTDHSFFKIEFYSTSIVRIHITQQESFSDFSYAVISSAEKLPIEFSDATNSLSIKTSFVEVVISKQPFHITFKNAAGKILNEDDPSFATRWNGEQVTTY